MKLGFIGFGNMAMAMVAGLVNSQSMNAKDINVSAQHFDKCQVNAAKYGVNAYATNNECALNSDIIVMAVKPWQMESVLNEIKEEIKDKIVVSVASGWLFDKLDTVIPDVKHLSMIPNTPVEVCKGILITEDKSSLTEEELNTVLDVFRPLGLITILDKDHIGAAGTLAGCTPAYVAMFIEALGDAGVKHGLKRKDAYDIAAKVLEGTGALYLGTHKHPGEMKDAVCSPAGTTIVGVASLEANGFRHSIIQAIDDVQNKKTK